eukprot:gb/GECG01014467.1/.p1 GENE.gb/GECG01014467.1/~~gb/GECG01014467.1/.p1  ORF type:complete len:425 (+),score=44.83 gb/GECG01014467.1/:1-1275(+)
MSHETTVSRRGTRAIRPITDYLRVLLQAQSDMFDPDNNPNGYVIMSVAENRQNFDTMREHLAKCRNIDNAASAYNSMRGMIQFRRAFAKIMEHTLPTNRPLDPEKFCISAGCGALVDNLMFILADSGESVLIPAPYYPAFDNDCCTKAENVVEPVPVDTDLNFDHYPLTVDMLEKKADEAAQKGRPARVLLLSNPQNPTADVIPESELREIIEWCRKRKIHLISDEIYAKSVFNPDPQMPFETVVNMYSDLGDYVHVLWGLSKDFGMSGYRVGAVYTENSEVLAAMDNIGCFCAVSNDVQECLTTAFSDIDFTARYLEENCKVIQNAFEAVEPVVAEAGIPYMKPKGGLFFWIDLRRLLKGSRWEAEQELRATLENDLKILLTPGESCHSSYPGFFRACIGWMNQRAVIEGFQRLARYYKSHTN